MASGCFLGPDGLLLTRAQVYLGSRPTRVLKDLARNWGCTQRVLTAGDG